MSFRFTPIVLATVAVMLVAAPAFSQMVFIQGNMTDADGKAVVGAQVVFTSADTNNKIQVKTDKKGHYVTNMKAAVYSVDAIVDGNVRFNIAHFEASGDPLDIKLGPLGKPGAPMAAAGPAPASAGGGGKPSKEEEAKQKEREAQLAKNKELNDAYNLGKTALDNKQWDEAITQLTKASELDPKQQAVWASLAQAYEGSAKVAKGADAAPIFDKAFAAYDKLLALSPDDAGTYNNYALALAADNKLDDAKTKLTKAVELDPTGAGKYHYNLGALLMNKNQTDGAVDEFKKAIAADPNYAEAYYYYGSTLVGKATLDQKTGKMVAPDGTVDALQKYLQLKPNGPNAQAAKDLIAALGSSVDVNYKDPNAPAPKSGKKGK